ncbi:synaptotagmin-like protein 2 isoform X1 [Chelonia mydas]|uniref:synaptotagmin-like protein 2 isoform X1 n=1 Tax=Chelonia mydas TaxID=8469 RepID=UPI0018A207AF|nr:synaptotagmin-like protein 2 isoform X1 [Chelonia mydas]XP_043384348.1 synaptotagmin-like protein 2 isoform X1 [Chelonia mydas]XP_043384350.1 synaptotagmin-like protein 2 isoform X1 [Chelonia mydas]
MIDLSFLTEEEQEAIMKVLQRDAELKRNEEERVRHLPEKIKNDNQLKNMSGQWFYEAKSKRHRDKIHGADIIRASIRRKPTTIAEQSQNKSDKTKNSWVNNVNKEVSVPAELSGIREEREEGDVKSNQSSNALDATLDIPQESSKKVAVSPGKQRKNPFNDFIAPEQNIKSRDSESGTTGLSQMPNEDTLSPSKESQSKRNLLNNRSEEHRQASGEQTDESQRIADQPPVPKARKVIYRITDPILEKDGSFPKPAKRTDRVSGAGTPPRGILKRSSSSSSTDSEVLRVNQIFDHQSKTGLPSSTVLERVAETNPPAEDPSQNSLERLKQVRFSSRTGTKQPLQSPQLQCGKDIGEFDLLENDTSRFDALQNEQTLPVKPPRSQSSASSVNATDRDASQEDTSAPYSSDANRSSLPVNETLHFKTSLPMEPVTPRKSSSNISPNVQEVQTVDETLSQNISKRSPNPDLESSKHTIDQQPLSAKTKSTQVPNASTADLQQGKPVLVENQSAKTTSKPDKHAAEFMKAADESISKVLDWFKRSSSTGDENTPSVTSQRRESKEELYLSSRARVITTKDSGPSTDENTPLIDLSFGNHGKPSNVLKPAAVDAEDIQILKVGKKENQSQEIQGTDYNKGPIVLGKSKSGREKIHLQVTDLPDTKLDETNILKKSAAEGKMLYKPEDESAAYKEPTFLKDGKGKPGSKSFSSPEKLNEGSLLKTNVQTGIQKEEEKICTINSLLEEDHVQSQTGFDDRGIERKEPGLLDQGSMQLDPSSSRTKLPVLPQHESKQPSQVQISDEETEQKRRVRDIRAFWERDKTGPRLTNKEGILSTTPSASSTAQYINKGSRTVKPTDSAASLSSESKVQNKHSLVTVRVELSDDEASKDKFLKSSKTGPDIMEKSKANHNVEKSRKILQSDGKVNEFTKLPKANHLQPRIDFTPASSNKCEDWKQVSPENDRNPASTQQKPNFKILSLKEKIDEESKNQISNPLHFQSLRSFWDIGAKSHVENETTSPGNISSATYQRESKELKESRAEMSEEEVMVQQQNQLPLRERTKKINFKVPESPRQEGQPIPWSVNLTRTENAESVQIVGKNVGKSVISKPEEKVDLLEQEVKEYIEKRIVPPKVQHSTFNSGLQKLLKEMSEAPLPSFQPAGDKGSPREELGIDEQLIVSVKTMQSKAAPTDSKEKAESPKEEVAETVDKTVAPSKAELNAFNAGLEKLLKETSQIPSSSSSQNVTENTSEETVSWPGQRRFFEKVIERSHNTYPRYQKEEALPQEVKETMEKTVIPPKDELHELKIGLGKLLKESDASCPLHQAADADEGIQRESSYAEAIPSSSPKAMHPGIAAYVMTQNEAQPPGEAVSETVEKTTVPPKTEFCDLDAGLKKLLKEASKISFSSYSIDNSKQGAPESVPEEDGQRFYKQVTETDQGTSVAAQQRVGTPDEIGTVERTTVPYQDNVSPIDTCLEKPDEEAAKVLLPLHAKSGENVSSQPEDQTDHPISPGNHHEVTEILVKTVQPKPELREFNASLQKLLKEASEMPPSDQKSFDNEMHVRIQPNQSVNCTYQQDIDHPQEVKETIAKAVAPSKSELSEFNSGLEKLLKEVSEMQTPKLKSMENAMQKSMGVQPNQSVDLTYQQDTDHPQEVNETIAKAVAPSKSELGDFNASLQKLLREASETPPLKLKSLDSVIQGRTQPNLSAYSPFQQEMDHAQEIKETVEKTVAPTKAECSELNICLKKLLKEASDVSSQLPTKMGKQERPNDSVSQAEKESLAIKMPLSGPSASSGYRTEFKIPIKRETLKQNDKAVKEDHVVNEVRGSALPEINVAFEKTVQTNLASTEALPKERENGAAVIKTHKMEIKNENKREEAAGKEVDKSVSLADDSEATSVFRRASTPLKDDDRSSKISKVELLLASPYDDQDDTISFGSDLSGSTCSEEELDPILKALKRSADRQRPSKSLEDIPSATSNKGKVDIPKEELVLSAEDDQKTDQQQETNENVQGISTVPSDPDNQFSNPEKLKRLSKSVPAFLQEESDDRDTDTTSESSYHHGRIKKSPSSLTNLSGSSGMASLSSVSGSVMSVYSGDFGNVDVKGHIQFAIDYVEQLKELHIFVSQCKDLAIADVKKQHSDPYVKTYLLPEKYKLGKRKTSVKKKTLNPVFNEILRYKIDTALVKTQRLNLSVWHNDTFGRNSFLGEVELDLGTWDWNDKQNKQMNWFPLKPRTPAAALELENRGEIKLALQYVPQPVGGNKTPSTGEVHIWVKECNDLPLLRGNKLNSFVKCTILPDTSRKSRQKTRAVAKTTNPVFNHTMVYDGFRTDDLKEACVELTVWDHHKLANHFLGGLRIGMGTGKSYGTAVDWMDSTLDETTLWERMMSSPNKWVEDTLPLRMLMVAKLTK